jgi:hypothetical protein
MCGDARPPSSRAALAASGRTKFGGVSRTAEQSRKGAMARSPRRLSIPASLRSSRFVRLEGNAGSGANSPFGADIDDNV